MANDSWPEQFNWIRLVACSTKEGRRPCCTAMSTNEARRVEVLQLKFWLFYAKENVRIKKINSIFERIFLINNLKGR
jgi:hypothetical protein